MINEIIKLFLKIKTQEFFQKNVNVYKSQEETLMNYIKENKDTEFGKKYNFVEIKNIKDYQNNVPITTYDFYEEYIKDILEGKNNVLTKEKVLVLEQTSGSSGKKKYIPYTSKLQQEYNAGIFPWLYDLSSKYKKLFAGSMYWSITPAIDDKENNENIKIGFEEDAEYLGAVGKIIKKWFAVPKLVSKIQDLEKFQIVTCIFLFSADNLKFVSVWNASFLTNLLECFENNKDIIIDSILSKRILVDIDGNIKASLEKLLSKPNKKQTERLLKIKNNELDYKEIFSNIELVSAWGDANALIMYEELQKKLGSIYIQKKGILATEGIISIPLVNLKDGHLITYKSHFFEFIDIETDEIKLLNELEKDKQYSLIMTTGGGLYRYKLGDIIKVIDYYNNIPVVKFICRENVSDYCGEKLNEDFVVNIQKEVFEKHKIKPLYALFAPICIDGKYSYRLYLEATNKYNIKKLEKDFETALRDNFHYDYCRKIGQILDFKIIKVKDGNKAYIKRCTKEFKQKLGNIKNNVFSKYVGWEKYFEMEEEK